MDERSSIWESLPRFHVQSKQNPNIVSSGKGENDERTK
jgi:hypothetical protein